MKKTLIALAALGAMAGAAHAQSTVTLYGLLDANFGGFKTNSASASTPTPTIQNLTQTKIESGGLNGSRWGMRMSEDLGGGMAAIGNLESGINLDTGVNTQTGVLFGRRANVGLSSGFGTVTLGRNSSSYDDVSADHAMMGQSIFDPSNVNNGITSDAAQTAVTAVSAAAPVNATNATAIANLLNRGGRTWLGYATRFDNSVKYISPNFSGFSGSAMYAFGENKTTTQDATKSISANLKYANGPLLVSGGYQAEGTRTTLANDAKVENTLLSVAYDFGVAKVGAGFNRAKFKDVFKADGTQLAAQNEWNLSVAVPLGATTLSAGYAQSKGDDLGKSTGFGVQALYALSKRTTLYAGGLSSKAYDNLADKTAAKYVGSDIGRATTYAVGMRHTF